MPYKPAEAARLVGCSVATIRSHATQFGEFLSPGASPGKGQPRVFSAGDVRVLKFVFETNSQGATLDQVADRLRAGELDRFDWSPEEGQPAQAQEAAQATALALPQMFVTIVSQLEESRRREAEEARRREDDLQQQLLAAREEAARLRGQLETLKGVDDVSGPRLSFWGRLGRAFKSD
jgi:DNA-binding transcriptional MerR regulator